MNELLENKVRFWEIVFYFALSVITGWLILKSIGVIQTPFWLQYGLPVGGFVLGILAFHHNIYSALRELAVGQAVLTTKVTHLEKKVDHLDEDVECLKKDMVEVKTDMGLLKNDANLLKSDMVKVKGKLSVA